MIKKIGIDGMIFSMFKGYPNKRDAEKTAKLARDRDMFKYVRIKEYEGKYWVCVKEPNYAKYPASKRK